MKFLCDQCKAKYQIADEKVQGKTLRMKCRKCGHVIEIKALPGAAAPSSMPPAGNPGLGGVGATMQLDSLTEEQAQAALAAPKAPFGRASGPGAKPAPGPPRPAAGAGPMAPRPAAGARAPLAGASLAKPAAKAPAPIDDDEPPNSVLANAFAKSVQKTPGVTMAATSSPTDPPAEEWYVAIDEVPVGPIRHTELRGKYGVGQVTDDSLVWREGFEEWRPLRTLPELHALVREDMSQRGSLLPSTPSKPTPRPATATTSGRTSAATPRPTTTSTPSPARPSGPSGNVIPFQRQAGVAARKLEEPEDDEVTRISSSPMFPPPAAAHAEPAEGAPAAMAKAGITAASVGSPRIVDDDPFATPGAPSASFTPASPSAIPMVGVSGGTHHDSVMMRLGARAGVSKGVVALIAAGVFLLGVVVAVLLVRSKQQAPEVQEKIVEKQVVVTNTVFVDKPGVPPIATVDPSGTTTAKVPGKAVPGSTTTAPTVAAAPTTTTTGKKWGPTGDEPEVPVDNSNNNNNATVGALDGKAVGEVAQRSAVGVRKACYEKWVETGPADAKVQVHIRPDGTVSSVDKLSGSPPQFLDCVARIAMNWKFPKSTAGGTYPIPFIFN